MPERVELNEEEGIIEVFSEGAVTHSDLLQSTGLIMEIYGETGVSKVLIDATKQRRLPNLYRWFHHVSSLPRFLEFAVVVGENPQTRSAQDLAEKVAQNRGISLRNFRDRGCAMASLFDIDYPNIQSYQIIPSDAR